MSRRIVLGALVLWAGVAVAYAWAIISHRPAAVSPPARSLPRPFAVSPEDFRP